MISIFNLNRLNRREKYYVAGAALMLAVFLLFQLIIFPISDKRDQLSRALSQKTAELKDILALQSEYFSLEKTAQRARSELAGRDKNFTLSSYLGNLTEEVGIKDNVSSMKPSTSTVGDVRMSLVELKIDIITMEQLAKYLYRIEYSGNNLFVRRMVISKNSKSEGYIDVSLLVETVES